MATEEPPFILEEMSELFSFDCLVCKKNHYMEYTVNGNGVCPDCEPELYKRAEFELSAKFQ